MAERRMFSKQITDSDAFMDMPHSTQNLYFHLGMQADDDGFLNNAKKIQRSIGCAEDDYKILLAKNFVIQVNDGVCVLKHWKVHNYIPKDRYKPTVYQEEAKKLTLKNNNVYSLYTDGIQNVSSLDTQVRIGKDRLGKVRVGKDSTIGQSEATPNNTPKISKGSRLSPNWTCPQEYIDYCLTERPELDPDVVAMDFKDYWVALAGAKAVKLDWFATWRSWVRRQHTPKKLKQDASNLDDWANEGLQKSIKDIK